jgi:hypothetical protein
LVFFLPFTLEHRLGARFESVGGYREKPAGLRFIVRGTAYALVLLVAVLGTVQIQKEYGAEACRMQSGEVTRWQLAPLKAAARQQGRWTPEMGASHKVIVRAAWATASLCKSTQRGLRPRLRNPLGADFEIRLDGPGPDPRRGR